MSGTLFVVGTPIGNLGDVTERARETLGGVDIVAAEDTRRTGRLLEHLGISKPMVSFFEGNEQRRTRDVLERLRAGEDVALVTDAGMPSISDPGFRVVRACIDDGVPVAVVPGPSAVLAALVLSGLPTDRFVFEGFPPRRAAERRGWLGRIATEPRTIVLFEAPARIAALMRDAAEAFGDDRQVAVARELTKLYEEIVRGTVREVLERVEASPLRGEIVVVFEGAAEAPVDMPAAIETARELLASGARKREAAAEAARRHGASANAVYRALLER